MLRPTLIGPREQWTPQHLCEMVLEELLQIFLSRAPGLDGKIFIEDIYLAMRRTGVDGDEILKSLRSGGELKLDLTHFIHISCAYCVQAQVAESHGKSQLAKSYLIDAFFYLGLARASMSTEPQVKPLQASVIKDALTANARNSVSASTGPWLKTAAEARRLILERARAGDRWATPTEAARAVADEVERFLAQETRRPFQSQKQRDSTIARWLRDMPEAPELFASRRKR